MSWARTLVLLALLAAAMVAFLLFRRAMVPPAGTAVHERGEPGGGYIASDRGDSTAAQVLPVITAVPDFELIDSRGQSLGLDDLKGRFWVVDFFFTTCPGPCPKMSANMASLHKRFEARGEVALVSVSVDPGNDTPDVLARYAEAFGADADRWHFLTGTEQAIRALAIDGLHLPSAEHVISHSTYFVLVDNRGQVRGYYTGTDAQEVGKLARDLERLLKASA